MKQYFAKAKGWLYLWVLLLTVDIGLDVFAAFFMQRISDIAISGDLQGLFWPVVQGFAYVLACYILYYVLNMVRGGFLRESKSALKHDTMGSLLRSDINRFSESNSAKYLTIFNNDINTVEMDYFANLPEMLVTAVSLVVYVAVLFYFSPILAAIDVLASMLLLVIPSLVGNRLEKAQRDYNLSMDQFNANTKDILNGFEVIKSFGAEQSIQRQFDAVNQKTENQHFLFRKLLGLNHSLGEGTSYLVMILNYSVGAYLVATGKITLGALLGALQMVGHITFPVRQIFDGIARYKGSKPSIQRILQLDQMEDTQTKEKQPLHQLFPIEVRDLHFGYNPEEPVLNGIDWKVEAGKKYAVVGASGCGKSTLIKLMMDYYTDFSGQITMGGQDIRDIDRRDLYHQMAMIQQSVIMFDDTFRNNITMYETYPDERIWEVLKESGLREMTEKLPQGLDSRIEENGKNFSGGERQRISIARAFIRNAPMVIMDEATSSLDNQTAYQIEQDILTRKGLTALVVTHKLNENTLKLYDEIIVLQHGRIIEQGSFQQLMERQQYFYSLYHVTGEIS